MRQNGERVLVHDYQLALVPGMVRGGPARPAGHALHPHPVLRTQLDPGAADRHGRGVVRARWPRCRAGSTPSGGQRPTSRRRTEVLGKPPIAPYATPLGPDPAALADAGRRARGQARRRRARRAGRRPQARAAQRPHRPLEEHRARVPRVRRAPRHPPRVARPRRVRRHAQPVAREPGRVPRLRARGRPGRGAGERPLGAPTTGNPSWSTRATTTSRPSPASPATTPSS